MTQSDRKLNKTGYRCTVGQLSAMLAERSDQVARMLLPQGKRQGNEWCIGSIAGEAGESLKVHLTGSKAGIFCDFATGETGDLIDLWRLTLKIPLQDTIKQVKTWLGIHDEAALRSGGVQKVYSKPKPKGDKLNFSSPVANYLKKGRLLTDEAIKAYRLGEHERNIIFPYFWERELKQVKYLCIDRQDGKKKIAVEANCQPCLFGWQAIPEGAREVVLCEGEIDAITLWQYGYPALSLPFGGGTGAKQQWVDFEFDRLERFDVIYLCLDQDEVGQATVHELLDRLGRERCRVVNLPHKDANECLINSITQQEIDTYFKQSQSQDPKELRTASSFANEVISLFNPTGENYGFSTLWEKARNKINFRPHELSVWTGINGHGKSQLLNHLALMFMYQNAKICIASLEMRPGKLLERMAKQAGGIGTPSDEYLHAIHEWYAEKLWLFNVVGTAKADRILKVFEYAHRRYQIDVFIIDSLMKCGMAEDDYNNQKAFVEALCDFKNTYKCHIHLVVHPRKAANENEAPGKLDVKGSGAISDLADNVFSVWRDKKKEDVIAKAIFRNEPIDDETKNKPDCTLSCDKQRNGDWEGTLGLYFHKESFQYLNNYYQRPFQFVNYSKQEG